MDLETEFEDAAERVQDLSDRPDNDTMLELYALYKQATEGDVSGKKPSRLKMRARAKHDAWEERSGLDRQDAMQEYVELVERLVEEDNQ